MTNTVQPARLPKLKHLIAGSIALLAMLAVMGIPIAYGLRKLGLIHVGGIVETASFTRASFDPGNPLDLNLRMEPHRGKERYAQAEIRAHMFVEVDGVERKLAEFVEIPVGNTFSLRTSQRMAAGGPVNLEATTFEESLLPNARTAGRVRVVVDEYAEGKCVNEAVADISVPLSFDAYDSSKRVFKSERSREQAKPERSKAVVRNGVLMIEWAVLETDTPESSATGIGGVVVNMAETTGREVHGMRIDLRLLRADATWASIGALEVDLAEARAGLSDKPRLLDSLRGDLTSKIREMLEGATLSRSTELAPGSARR